MKRIVYNGCFCSPWGGLLFDPVIQRHTKMRRKRQDPTDRTERESQKTKDGETHEKTGGNEEKVQGQAAGR